ncbi:MAG: methyltransferase domain-containing protein [Anaerolineae bacterium]|nr:methyltransferase domain-containing protein [Anaerolineae bacterium]MCB9130289.1 methyltransferase domain-containing protein [Anaerolineales bacterium]MCB0228916.1 methyltransferase domain-containing protein [Anaerolineae bacterium]MCB0240171.1 methyltransferase domain-containing protein [Anaerolineae bacterium]MCB0248983.1 methyltransferase domain-containing protein [Anaerolineae bacterium]
MSDFDRFARFYDLDYDSFQEDVAMYLGFAERTGGPLLELGCGTGRLLLPLAEAGYEVTGVDMSEQMLAIARAKLDAGDLSDQATLLLADMREVQLEQRYRLAFIAINSFMHLTTMEDQLAALRTWRDALLPGGLLVIDVFNPNPQQLLEADGRVEMQGRWFDPDTGATVMKHFTRTLDDALQLQHVLFIYDEVLPDGTLRRTLAPFQARYLYRFEGELLLDKAGFTPEQVYGSYDLDPFTSESERMIFVARRRG